MFDWGLLSPDFLFTYAFNACFFQFTVLQHLPSSAQLCSSFMGLFSLPQFICGFLTFIAFFQYSVQFSSVTQSSPTLCDPMNRSTPGLPVHHQLPEFTQTYVHWVGDAIQPSHPLSPPSPPAPNASQHQGIFQWVNSSHEVAKVLEFQPQHQSFQWTRRTGLLPILLSHKKNEIMPLQ